MKEVMNSHEFINQVSSIKNLQKYCTELQSQIYNLKREIDQYKEDAKRHRYMRETTKAIRYDDGVNKVEVTPEKYDKAIDIAITLSKASGNVAT